MHAHVWVADSAAEHSFHDGHMGRTVGLVLRHERCRLRVLLAGSKGAAGRQLHDLDRHTLVMPGAWCATKCKAWQIGGSDVSRAGNSIDKRPTGRGPLGSETAGKGSLGTRRG